MILITGAGGKTGRVVAAALRAEDQPVRAAVRTAGHADPLQVEETIVIDLLDPASLEPALRDVRAVYHICPNVHPREVEIGRGVLEAAERAQVEHFVLHSVLHPQTQAMPHHWNKLLVEELLINSGMPFTILQPASYMQNLLSEWWRARLRSQYHVPYALSAPFSPVDLADVAEVAAGVLAADQHHGATYELAGPDIHTPKSIADEMSEALGKLVSAVQIPIADWPFPEELEPERRRLLTSMFEYYSQHGLWGNVRVLEGLLGRRPTSLLEYLNRLVQEGQDA